MVTFETPYTRRERKVEYEHNSGEVKVETAGYVPANVLIDNMVYAGKRLDLARSEYYDYPDAASADVDAVDPTRTPGFDLADAGYLARSVGGRIAEQRKLYLKEQEARKKKEAELKQEFEEYLKSKKEDQDVKKEEKDV